ncbi:MAG: holo-ACP synthase [Actinobacteria bacterium]|nr:holo-ACP synthase [Actinomycetota bacterium]
MVTGIKGSIVGVGVDAVEIPRFRRLLERRPLLEGRLFTDLERAVAGKAGAPARLAARFAAKEAAMKALGVGLGAFGFREVEVCTGVRGAPMLIASGRAAELAERYGVGRWAVSLTHTDSIAVAFVVAMGAA